MGMPSAPESKRAPTSADVVERVPFALRVSAAWSWRVLLIAAVVGLFCWLFVLVRGVAIPMLIGLLVAALLKPLVDRLVRWRIPKVIAVIGAEIAFLAGVTALVWLVSVQLRSGLRDMTERVLQAYGELRSWLLTSPFHVSDEDIGALGEQLKAMAGQDSRALLTGVLSIGSTAGSLLTGFVLVLFTSIFLLFDASRIFRWHVRLAPVRARSAVAGAGRLGWHSLSMYVRVQILVAAIDAVGIGLGALILGLPLVVPMTVLVFLASFVPFIGAIVAGFVAVAIALVFKNWVIALIMLGIVILVQQVEAHVLQPLIMGSAVKVHPLGVVAAVAVGTLVGGIPGAIFAVPLVAVVNVVAGYLARRGWETDPWAGQFAPRP